MGVPSTQDRAQHRFEWDDVDAAKFAEYHAENPKVYELLRRFALEARRAGRTRLSINLLFERVRWFTEVETRGDTFKVNNTHRAWYARLLMSKEPELSGCFETRKAKADAVTVGE
jgi:hypothetical protein